MSAGSQRPAVRGQRAKRPRATSAIRTSPGIHAHLPGTKLILTVRSPVTHACSQYWQHRRWLIETRRQPPLNDLAPKKVRTFNLDILKVGDVMEILPRQSYIKEYREQAVKLVTEEQLMTKSGDARKSVTDLEAEVSQLRWELAEARMERDILKSHPVL
jgi:hypothetical protein